MFVTIQPSVRSLDYPLIKCCSFARDIQFYSKIAAFEDITFEFCECVDAKTGEELRHPKGECLVPGMVVVKIIYTEEEARRRKEEDKEVFEVFKKTDKQVSYDTVRRGKFTLSLVVTAVVSLGKALFLVFGWFPFVIYLVLFASTYYVGPHYTA